MAKHETVYIGIDGEGVRGHSPEEPNHHYILLAAVSGDGSKRWAVEDPAGLSTLQCLRFLVNLPKSGHRIFAYSFNYDLTKLLADLDPQRLYLLFRPELRPAQGNRAKQGPRPVYWRGYTLNLQGTKFTIEYGGKKVIIWDIWKFYQSKFVGALQDWKIGNPALYERMTAMKNKRATFDIAELDAIREYCFEECACMGQLAKALVEAHDHAGLKLTSFYGAGSSAGAMLKKMGILEKLVDVPKDMIRCVSQAFFGGRFENSVIGAVRTPCYNRDISSAYPYQTCFLPCLLHGKWRHVRDESSLESVRTSLVRYRLNPKVKVDHWAPFPFRAADGSICYPASSPGGWVWSDEYQAGKRAFPELVKFKEAWIYDCSCDCQPFADVPHYYRERIRIGKEGAGMVYKLGCNSLYGKIAQSVGASIFNNWIWAGLITSGCRAQILDLFLRFADRSDIVMIATDGLLGKKRIECPVPRDTGTFDCVNKKTGEHVPLGGWEESVMPSGAFMARPGIYFPLNPTANDIAKVKGRGVGKGVVLRNHQLIVDSWETYGLEKTVNVHGIERFCGAKTSISYSPEKDKFTRAKGGWEPAGIVDGREVPARRVAPSYGEWIDRTVVMSFDPMPKRAGILKGDYDGPRRLELRHISQREESMPYQKVIQSAEAIDMIATTEEFIEQPDLDYEEVGA